MTGKAVQVEPSVEAAMASAGARVQAHGLTRRFGERSALDAVSLEVAPGETLALLGPNGAGKTTFIRLVTGFLLPSAGSVRVDGLSPVRDASAVHARIGYVMETSRLYPDLRVRSFLRFAAGIRGLAGEARDAAVDVVLARFELGGVARRRVGNLSKGYQQRVSLAQAFLHDPPLLIADEPSSGLDPVQQREVREILGALRGRRTLLLCTHDLAEARTLADRVGVLRRGRLVALGGVDAVLGGADPLALFQDGAPAAAETRP